MTSEGDVGTNGQWWRAVLAFMALAIAVFLIYQIFSSGFGRTSRIPVSQPVPAPATSTSLAVISDNFWLTYLPPGLDRTGGGAVEPSPGVEGGWARFGGGDRYVEAQVEHGTVAADWDTYRTRVTLSNARSTTVRGKPALVGKHPSGGMSIVWLERVGTGAWIRVSDSLGKELLRIAASVRAPVGD